jgi:hypothetical protein
MLIKKRAGYVSWVCNGGWDNGEKLLRHYREEKTKHETPTREAINRRDNCDRAIAVKYDSLPSGL